jgi:hypothetical protein
MVAMTQHETKMILATRNAAHDIFEFMIDQIKKLNKEFDPSLTSESEVIILNAANRAIAALIVSTSPEPIATFKQFTNCLLQHSRDHKKSLKKEKLKDK